MPFSSPGDLPKPGIEPMSPVLAGGFFLTESPEKSIYFRSQLLGPVRFPGLSELYDTLKFCSSSSIVKSLLLSLIVKALIVQLNQSGREPTLWGKPDCLDRLCYFRFVCLFLMPFSVALGISL